MLGGVAGNLTYTILKECSTFIFKGWWVLQLPTLKKKVLCSFEIWRYITLPNITQDQKHQYEHWKPQTLPNKRMSTNRQL